MRRQAAQIGVLCMCTMLTVSGVCTSVAAEETELEDIISFEELAAAAAQGYDGEDLQNDIYKEQDPSFVKETVITEGTEQAEAQTAPSAEETETAKAKEEAGTEVPAAEASTEVTEEAAQPAAESEDETSKSEDPSFDTRDIFERSELQVGFSNTGVVEGIHLEPYKESDLSGILKPYGCVEIYSETEDGWYEVQSGDIYGYISKYVIATGDEAVAIAEDVVYMSATPTVKKVKIRRGPSKEEEEIGVLKKGEEIEVLDPYSDWITVMTADGEVGYMMADKVAVRRFYPMAMTWAEYDAWAAEHQPEEETEVEQEDVEEEEAYEEAPAHQETYSNTNNTQQYTGNTGTNNYTAPQQTEAQPQTNAPQQTEAQPATDAPQQTEAQPATDAPQQTEAQPATDAPQQTEAQPAIDPAPTTDVEVSENTGVDNSGSETVVVIEEDPNAGGEEEVYNDIEAGGDVYEDDGEVYEDDGDIYVEE